MGGWEEANWFEELSALDVDGCEGCSASAKGALDQALTWLGRAGVMRNFRAGFPGGALGVFLHLSGLLGESSQLIFVWNCWSDQGVAGGFCPLPSGN